MKSKTLNASSRALHGAARFVAPICKFALSLCAALGIASVAQAADNVWEGDDDGYWETEANWTNPSGDYWVINGNATSKAVKFNSNPTLGYTLAIVTDGVTFSGDDASDGLVQTAGDVRLGAWANGALTISSGTHVLNELAVSSAWWDNTGPVDGTLTVSGGSLTVNTTTWVGSGQSANAAGSDGVFNVSGGSVKFVGTPTLGCVAGATGTLNINSGTATASTIVQGAGTGYVTFNGGTLSAAGAGTLIDAGLTVTLNAGGGTIATDYDVTVVPAMTGAGSLTKTGSGILTLSAMPTFSGTITVAADAGSVILPSGATIAAGTYTATRTVENGVEYYSNPPLTITQDDIAGDSIVLANDTTLNVTANANFGNLTVSGPYTLTLAGSSAITATSLNIAAGTTVQLASGTTLADGRIVTTSVTGAGVIGYTGVNPDSSVGYDNSAAWTGTVWIQGLTGLVDWNPTAFGNSASTLRLSGVAGYFVKAQLSLPFAIELENDIYSYGIDLTNGYSFNSTGGWCYVKVPTLKGTGTYKTSGSGGNLFVVTDDWSGFTGSFSLANKTVWLGYGTPEAEVDFTPGTVAGGIRIAEGKSVNWSTSWTLSKFFGEGTIKMAAPWDATPAFAGYVGDSMLWTGTVELAACVNDGTGSVAVYPDRMGNANSKIVFKGLAPGATKGYYLNGSTAATVQLDGPVTISDASSSARYEIGVLTGANNFTGATSVGTACTFVFNAISNYTGTISANSKSLVTVGTYIGNTEVDVDQKLVGVDPNNANVSLNSVTIGGVEQTVATALKDGNDGYGLYVAALRRDVYWIGGASGNWGVASNWALADGTVLSSWPNDSTQYAGDNVIFTNAASVAVDKKVTVTKITLDADVTFSCDNLNGGVGLWFETMDGEGKLRMSNLYIAIISSGSRHVTIMNDVEVVDGSSNVIQTGKSGLSHIYGDVTGGGTLTFWTNGNNGGLAFHGDNSGFDGTFDTSASGSTRNDTSLFYGNASSANAIWKVKANSYSVQTASLIRDSGTYYFGALQGYVNVGDFAPTIVVGGRSDENSTFNITSRKNTKVVKTGSGLATQTASGAVGNGTFNTIYSHDIYGGTMVLDGIFPTDHISFLGVGATLKTPSYAGGDDRVYPDVSALIKNSSSAICFDDGGEDFTWATVLASSNTGGLTKKGAGTLTLSVIPLYKGPTVVKEGKLVVSFGTKFESLVLEGDATVEVDMSTAVDNAIAFSSGKFTGNADNVILQDNAPAGYGGAQNLGSSSNLIFGNGSVTYTWKGPTDDDYAWETASNWSPEGVPGMMDKVVFGTGTPGFTLAADVTVMSLEVNAQGFAYSADYALTVLGYMTVSVPGTLAITGTGSLEVNGDISGVTAIAMTPSPATQAIVTAHPYYTEKFRTSNPLELVSLEGAGTINANDPQTVTIAQDATSTFYGSLTGGMSLTKEGEGTLELQGPNSFTGDIDIREGSLKVSRYNYDEYVSYDFDASNSGGWTFADASAGTISKMTTSVGKKWTFASTGSAYAYLTNGFFGGATSVYFPATSHYEPDYNSRKNYRAYTIFTVYQCEDVSTTGYLHCYSTSQDYIGLSGGGWLAHCYTSSINDLLYVDGQHDRTAVASKKSVVSLLSGYAASDNRWDAFGINGDGGYIGAVGEIIGLDRVASIEQRAAIESYLMQKWGCDDAVNNQVLPKTAAVTMAPGTTLDMGGLTQTVKSFTGAGTVANGSLKTTGDFTVVGDLTVQATEGQEYTLAQNGSQTLTMTGDAKGYVLKVPDGAKEVCRVVVPDGLTYGFEGKGTFDVTVVNAPARWVISAKDVSGGKRLRIGGPGFYLNIR